MVSNSRRHELRPTPLNDEGHDSPSDLNLTQLVEHEKSIRIRRMRL
jgi:hypothetical protein